jgi:hypothetical protein
MFRPYRTDYTPPNWNISGWQRQPLAFAEIFPSGTG